MIARTVQSSRASASADALECRRAFSADVVIHLRPVHALTVTDDLVFRRWAGLAAASLHDQASGTLMTRPSARWAVILSSVTSTRLILAPLLAAVLIPCLQNPAQVAFNIRPAR